MNLNDIKEYPHKIKKILITNPNLYSINDYITIKISLDDVQDDEVIRFSLKENDDFVHHQSIDDDYFIRIPNNLNTITTLYAHYFIYDLYQYEEIEEVYSIYPFQDLFEKNPINKQGIPYKIQIESKGYDMQLGSDNKPYIRSLLNNSIDKYKNPNYKNYYNTNIEDKRDMTIQGMFPLSSRYRPPYQYINAPNLTTEALWQATENDINCTNRRQITPYWEAKIHRTGLSPLISDQIDGEYAPINVFLNYNYLPTTTEYHQHYFGFEGKHYQDNNPNKPHLTLNSDLNIFEGTNVNTINNFGNNNNYRIINVGNPFDDTYSMFVDHEHIIQLDLNNAIYTNCQLKYNKCDKYWTYTPLGKGQASLNIKLDKEHLYTLKYYIYIPQDTECEPDSCYITVNDNKIHDDFIKQDKILRNQWIYHEVPFVSQGEDIINIIGPQHNDDSHQIHFIYLTIEEFQEYSPTIKYASNGLHISEKNKTIIRSTKGDDNCVSTPTPTHHSITPKTLPNPNGKILFSLDNDIDIYYDRFTSDMYYYHPSTYTNIIKLENNLLSWTNDNDLSLTYSYEDTPSLNNDDTTSLTAEYQNKIVFIQGVNNNFILYATDSYNNIVSSGDVECAIIKDKESTPEAEEIVKNLGTRKITQNGTVFFDKIDLRNIPVDGDYSKYYLRIKYINPCDQKVIYDYKAFYIEPQRIHLTPFVNNSCKNHQGNFILQSNDDGFEKFGYSTPNGFVIHYPEEELPLKVSVFVQNQNGSLLSDCTLDNGIVNIGYCELSIDDELKQVSIVDINGECDFYLDMEDLTKLSQVVKIEYYNRYYEAIDYIYFDIVFDEQTKLKPIIPIKILLFDENGISYVHENDILTVDKDECVLMDIDTDKHKRFRFEIYEHNTPVFNKRTAERVFAQNFAQINEQELFYIVGLLNDANINSPNEVIPKANMQATTKYYTFVTTNMMTDAGIVIDDLWREYHRTLQINFTK